MDDGIKIYVTLNEKINQYIIMVTDYDKVLHSDVITQPYLGNTLTVLRQDFGNSGRPVTVFYER